LKKLLVLDNYDSFTYNLVHLAKEILEQEIDVFRNDEISIDEASKYEKILLSPGPGIPEEAGILLPLIKALSPSHSILGVCLGHQAIGQVFGGTLNNLSKVYHGVATSILIEPELLASMNKNDWFIGLDQHQIVGRYHSWVVNAEGLPEVLEVTSKDELGMIMSLRHKTFDVQGVQFHPESVLTENGRQMLENWLKSPQQH
jgi:anthranilate synthase component 2